MRSEVESLVSHQEKDEQFIAKPALGVAAKRMAQDQVGSMVGRQIGSYKILSRLGAGGMGEVYLAEDTSLGRKVAIKMLHEELTKDADRLRRFKQEARTASALNHPNILTVHEIASQAGLHFIATEFIEGQTLRHHIDRSPMPLASVLDLSIQIASALATAHQAGIVHRDIKPDNIMLRTDGYVKLLDFGIAKLTEGLNKQQLRDPDATTVTLVQTEPGTVIGTPNYMSPEQARGLEVDARTDIFSLGTIIYEMATGHQPFCGATISDVIVSVLEREPPPLRRYLPEAPAELQRIVSKALRKDKEERYQVVKELLLDLKSLKQESEFQAKLERSVSPGSSGQTTVIERGTVKNGEPAADHADVAAHPTSSAEYLLGGIKRHKTSAILGSAIVVVAAGLTFFILRSSPMPKVLGYTQITSDGYQKLQLSGTHFTADFFINGSLVTDGPRTYFSELAGEHFVLSQVSSSGGEAVAIPTSFPNPIVMDILPRRSELLVVSYTPGFRAEGALWAVPVLGGSSRPLGNVLAHGAAWSPDGQQIGYANGSDLYLAKSDGTEPHQLVSLDGRAFALHWSPGGSRLRFTIWDQKANSLSLWEVAADGTDLHPLLPGWNSPGAECCGNWTADGKYFVFQSTRNQMTSVWAMQEKAGFLQQASHDPVRLTVGPINFLGPVPSKDGSRFFAVGDQRRGELVRYDAQTKQFVTYLGGISADGLDFSRDGQWVAYVTYPEGCVWRSKVDGSQRLQLSFPPMRANMPRWSPDGRKIAFPATIPGKPWKIYMVSSDGGSPEKLMPEEREERNPGWSPDGNSLVFDFRTETSGSKWIQVLDVRTGQVSMVPGSEGLYSPRWSPDGRYIVALPSDSHKLLLFDFTTKKWVELASLIAAYPQWSHDGNYVYFSNPYQNESALCRVRIGDHQIERVVSLNNTRLATGAVARWMGLAPDDSPLVLRDLGTQEIYALDWVAP